MRMFKSYRGLPRSIYVLFWIQIINRFGDFVVPFLTLLLTNKLGFTFGVTGAIVTTASLITIPASFIGGKLADQFGRKKTYLIGQTVAACCILACGFIKSPFVIVVLLISSSFFNGFVRPAITAIIADVLTPEKRQAGSSLSYLGINIGTALGPIVAGFLFNNYLTFLFIGDALTSFIAVGVFYIFIKETKPVRGKLKEDSINEREEEGNTLQVLLRRPQIIVFLFINVIYSLVYMQHRFTLPMMLDKVFPDRGPEFYGLLMSVNAVTVLVLTIFIISLTKRFKPLVNIILSGIFYTVGFGMIWVIQSFWLYVISTVLWTIGEILNVTNFGVFIANNSPKNFRARFSAVSNLSFSVGSALGTSAIGIFIDYAGISSVWPLTFILSSTAVFFMTMLHMNNNKRESTIEEL